MLTLASTAGDIGSLVAEVLVFALLLAAMEFVRRKALERRRGRRS